MNAEQLKTKKITMATLKSFVNKSKVLFVEHHSSFDGMTDCVQSINDSGLIRVKKENAIGINGVYCVGRSRDYFKFMETPKHYGIKVYNSCGSSTIWTNK